MYMHESGTFLWNTVAQRYYQKKKHSKVFLVEVPTVTKVWYQLCTTGPSENGKAEQKMFNETREATNSGQIIRAGVFSYAQSFWILKRESLHCVFYVSIGKVIGL